MDEIVITLDVDWAPDFVIEFVANLLIERKIRSTWFITHDSHAIRSLSDYPDLFELGIHPNFMPGSTHGSTPEEVMETLLQIVPRAESVRTHGLFQSSSLMKMIAEKFGLKNDVSIYLREVQHIVPFEAYYDDNVLLRIPYYWTEDGEMYKPKPSFSLNPKKMHQPGLKIFGFHPIHVYLNSRDMCGYTTLKQSCDIRTCSEKEVKPCINIGTGTGTFFKELMLYCVQCGRSHTISDISAEWNAYSRQGKQ